MMNETMKCGNSGHDQFAIGSKYPRNAVPQEMFVKILRGVNAGFFKYCSDCRNYKNTHRGGSVDKEDKEDKVEKKISNKKGNKIERNGIVVEIDNNTEFVSCSSPNHVVSGSRFPYNNVPKILFLKDDDRPDKGVYKTCKDCREYKKEQNKIIQTNKNKEDELKSQNDDDTIMCSNPSHETPAIKSAYPRSKVPKSLFYKDPNNPDKGLYKTCLDCRNYSNKNKINNDAKRKLEEYCEDTDEFVTCPNMSHDIKAIG